MLIGRWSNIGFRLSALSLLVVLCCALSTGAIGYLTLRAALNEAESDIAQKEKAELLQSIAAKASANESIAAALAKSLTVQDFMAREDRESLIRYLRETFTSLNRYDINNIHFHRPNMRTFARLHAPSQYDDDLSSLRPMIASVIKEERPRRGIELGLNGLPIRGATVIVTPDGRRLGVVEVGSFLNAKFLADIAKEGTGYRIHLRAADRYALVAESAVALPPAFSQDALDRALSGADSMITQKHEGDRYVSLVFPLRDYAEKPIGAVEIHLNASALDILSPARINFFIVAILALALISVSATLMASGTIFRRLDQLIASVKAIAAGSSRTPPPLLTRADGFGDFARAIEDLRQSKLILGDALLRAEASDRSKAEFLSVMSHELRTPLNAIIGFSEMITLFRTQNVSSAEKEQEYIDHIQASGRHLLSIIEEILTISSLEAEATKPVLALIDIREDVDFVIALMEEQMRDGQLSFRQDVSPDLPLVLADSRSIRQILLNLLGNAIKFTPPPGEVSLSVKPVDGGIEMCVSDTGPGIAPEHMLNVFKPFFQVEEAAIARRGGGVGLGLSITNALVGNLHGTLELSNRAEGGLVAVVRIPLPAENPDSR